MTADTARARAIADRLKRRRVNRFVVTAAQNATPVHAPFFRALLRYCRHRHAEMVVIPYRYRNPTSQWTENAQEDDWWAPELVPFLLDTRLTLNDHLLILGDIKTQPTAVSPLSGFETLTGGRSAIIGHPKLELLTIPTPQHKLPKVMTTTGAVTVANYTDTKAGKKGEHHHTFGAAVVEVAGDVFHLRQLNAQTNGEFIDLTERFTSSGVKPAGRAAALVMGDSHIEFIDPAVVRATFTAPKSMIKTLKPRYLVWHDVHDFFSRNHHHRGECFTNYAKHHAGLDNIERWLDHTFAFIDKHTPANAKNVFVPSNHPDALLRWLKESDPRDDPENGLFWARTYAALLEQTRMTPSGTAHPDPFVYWAKQKLKTAGQAVFLDRDQSFQVQGIEVGYHGDQGPNGARGSIRAFGKIGTKTIIGHSHSPGIRDGVYQVGLSARYRLEYNHGPSSWLHTHCVVYGNGKRSLITIIGNRWRA
ncbi:MAG TPA: hypothetical protein VFL54_04530 [Gammaproteobacteria bacterium]|nr:hypothetical protein [Gammaproteobacteria bacterium]